MKKAEQICKKCGKPISIITWGIYRKSIVDAEPVWVRADANGEEYVRIDGCKLKALPVEIDGEGKAEPAYRLHGKSCGRKE